MTKTCSRCKQTKDVSLFSRDRSARDGYQRQCKACRRESRIEGKGKGYTLYEAGELRWMPEHILLEECPRWLLQEALGIGHNTAYLLKSNPWDPRISFQELWNDDAVRRVQQYLERLDDMGVGRITRCKATKLRGEAIEKGKEAALPSGPKTLTLSV